MILYNVTIKISDDVHHDWLEWMRTVHIPDVMNTGYFVENKLLRVMNHDHDGGGFTYAIQYYCESISHYNQYQENYASKLQEEHTNRYKDKFVAFRTIMKQID